MSKISDLIAKLCPNGVEYKKLGEVAHYSANRIDAGCVNAKTYVGVESLLAEKQGKIDSTCVPSVGRLIEFLSGDVLIGNIRPYLKKIWLADCDGGTNGDVLVVQINDRTVLTPEYLYYVLSSDSFFLYDMQFAKGAKMPRGDKESILGYLIPVPPVKIQREVVEVLDKFALLTAELTAELEKRKKQYEHYRDKLLKFTQGYKQLTLGEIGTVAMCKRILKSQTSNEGEVPFFKIGTFGKVPDAFISKGLYDEYRAKYSYPRCGDILISAAGTIGRTVIYNGEPAYYQDSNIVWLAHDERVVLNKYLYYFYQQKPWHVSEGGTIPRLYNDNILKTKIAVPPLAEQERIVKILDKFDKLCNDLTSGLPAEIAARKKQYEYYRDKLLTFRKAG